MINRIPAFFISIIIIFSTFGLNKIAAQNYNIDSLETILENSHGIKKIPIYYNITDYYVYNSPDKAIRYANEFLILAEKIDSTLIIEYCYQILGEAHYLQENYDNSLDYFTKYLNIQLEKDNKLKIGKAYNNLGIVYRTLDDYTEAIQCYKKSMEIYLELNNIEGLNNTYNNLGVLYEYLELFAQANEFYKKSLKIELGLNDQEGISTSYLNLGGINLKLKNYSKAIDFCEKSIKISDSLDFKHTLEVNYDILYQTYNQINNTEKALFYLEKFYELKNSRINQDSNYQIAELEIKYQSDKKQQEIELLNKQKKQKKLLNIFGFSGLFVFSGFIIFLILVNKLRRNNNRKLNVRNVEVMQQKEEIEAQRDEIEAQRDEIKQQIDLSELQTDRILKQNKDITDSIEYAKHIQIALFPDKITLQKTLKNGFCLFKPKDIVSGDFYWVAQIGNKSIIAAADCTGHGVPGAFMSIIGINFLNEIIYDEHVLTPKEILNQLRKKIIKTMVHANRISETKDGMDISLIVIDYDNMKLEYAGAYNNLYYIRDHMLNVIKADRMPVGISEKSIAPFTNHTIDIQKGDLFYMFTDGYTDQFGGPQRKKFRPGNLRELLLEIHENEMPEQKRILFETFINWKSKEQQVDDILSIGVKI
ncbi:MAG: tetratricopeptide repeat protein [Bacteroidales bacterium]|jgi:serine phosphatase RsbU (regulator of sigma subunit)|nr:tetratricopeptide repeat protein [Bacteroidales bacterium]